METAPAEELPVSKFPKKFRDLIEAEPGDVARPVVAFLVYSVCAVDKDSCGWAGWALDGVFREYSREQQETLPQIETTCPCCGKNLFRTIVSYRFDLSPAQQTFGLVEGVDYETDPIEYE